MRGAAQGWRSARWRGGAEAPVVESVLPPVSRQGRSRAETPVAIPPSDFPIIENRFQWPWQGVDFGLGYVLFLVYVFVISSYVVNLGAAAIAGAILALSMGGKDRWKLTAPMFFMAAFLLVVGLTYKSTAYRNFSWTSYEDITKVFIIATVAASVLANRARLRFFMFFYLAAFAFFPVRGGIFNWFIYRAATQGRVAWNNMFENPNDFAALMIFPLGLCLAVFVCERAKILKKSSLLGLAAIPMLIFMTQSRGAIVALAAGVVAYFVIQGKGRAKTIVAVGAIAIVVVVFAPSSVWSRLSSLKNAGESGKLDTANDNHSAEQRFEIWRVAWSVHNAFPVTGVGWGAYPNAHSDFSRRSGMSTLARGARDAHNTYLTLLAETGWIGFLLWCGMVATVVVSAIRAMQRIRRYAPQYALQIKLVLLALFSYAVGGMFGSYAHMAFTYLHISTLIAMATIANKEVDAFERGPGRVRRA